VAGDFFDAMFKIVKANSPFTKLCMYFSRRFKQGQELLRNWPLYFLPKENLENYRYFGTLSHDYHVRVV